MTDMLKPPTLDIETAATDKSMVDHAGLEPYRLRQGKAKITSLALCKPNGEVIQFSNTDQKEFTWRTKELLKEYKGKRVYAHNAIFDLAWMIADGQPDRCGDIPDYITDVRWGDTMLLTKWLINGQLAEDTRFSYSLLNECKTFLKDHPDLPAFIEIKNKGFKAGENEDYWLSRGDLDVRMTQELAFFLEQRLPAEQRVGLMTEFAGLTPIANSWIMGIHINQAMLEKVGREYEVKKARLAQELGVAPTVMSSPKQLAKLLFTDWGLTPIKKTPTGNPSTAADDLIWMQYHLMNSGNEELAARVGKVREFKTTNTLHSKYVKSSIDALAHTGDGYIYGAPRVFGTYTGRMTYSNTTTSKDFETDESTKWKNGIALHQIPRKAKEVREFMEPPPGMALYEADASGQESRLMALRSKDPTMIKVFQDDMNFHAMTGASVIGMEYDDFMSAYKQEMDTEGAGYHVEQRQLGKLANLSCNYRIGGKSFSEKCYTKYDTYLSVDKGNYVVKAFNRTYPGVPQYWEDVVWEAREKGYTEAFGGRRYKLHKWQTDRWLTESSAISTPIQGAGASMKEIAIAETFKKVPEAKFCLDLHDASFFYVKEDRIKEVAAELDNVLNNIDYEPYWGFKPEIPLPYESNFGKNFRDVK